MREYKTLRLIRDFPTPNHVDISFLLRAKNEERDIKYCLDSIISQTSGQSIEIILLDSGSTDKTIEIAKLYPVSIYAIAPEEFSFGDTCNLLVSISKGAIVLIMSAHVEFISKNSVTECCDQIRNREATCGFFRQVPNTRAGFNAYEKAFLKKTYPMPRGGRRRYGLKGFSNAAAVYKRDDLINLPFPDVIASEDRLWAMVFISKGGTIQYFGNHCVAHSHNESPTSVFKRVRINTIARLGSKRRSLTRACYYFIGVFFYTIINGGSIIESLVYAKAHVQGYLSMRSD